MIALLILFWLICGVVAAGWYEADDAYHNYITAYLSTLLGAGFLLVWVFVRMWRMEAWGWEWPYGLPKFCGGWFKDKNNHHEAGFR